VPVLATVATKKDIRAVVIIDIGSLAFLGTVMGRSMADFEIAGVLIDVPGVLLEAVKGSCLAMLNCLFLTRVTREVDKFKRVGST